MNDSDSLDKPRAASLKLRAWRGNIMRDYKKLMVWQKGMQIVVQAYELAKQLPNEEKYGLRSQITKAAVSIPSNIAEGSAKSSALDYKRFLEMSLASSFELETQVLITEMLTLGEDDTRKALLKGVDEEQKMLISFIKRID